MVFSVYWRVVVIRAEVMNDAGIVRGPPAPAVVSVQVFGMIRKEERTDESTNRTPRQPTGQPGIQNPIMPYKAELLVWGYDLLNGATSPCV